MRVSPLHVDVILGPSIVKNESKLSIFHFFHFPKSALPNWGCGLSTDAAYTWTFTVHVVIGSYSQELHDCSTISCISCKLSLISYRILHGNFHKISVDLERILPRFYRTLTGLISCM